jgi:hypothetical protein
MVRMLDRLDMEIARLGSGQKQSRAYEQRR